MKWWLKLLSLAGILAVIVCLVLLAWLRSERASPVIERVAEAGYCRIVRVHLHEQPDAYTYRLIGRTTTLRLVVPPSTQPKLMSKVEYAELTGDGTLKTTKVEEKKLSSFGDDTVGWPGQTYADFSFTNVTGILGISGLSLKDADAGKIIRIGIQVNFHTGGMLNTGCSLELPQTAPGSPRWYAPDTEAGWEDDEIVLQTYTVGDEKDDNTSFRIQVVLKRSRKQG